MTTYKLATVAALAVTSVTMAFAMDMMGDASSSMIKDSMMEKNQMDSGMMKVNPSSAMKENSMVADDMSMVTMSSAKSSITKLQMMLVDKGYLIMPHGVLYGYYGPLTRAAYGKYKNATMTKKDTGMMTH
jgi:hypothetical protein